MILKIHIHCKTILYFQYNGLIFNTVQCFIFHCLKSYENDPREHPYQRTPGTWSHDCFKAYLNNEKPIGFNMPVINNLLTPSLVGNIIHSTPVSQIVAEKMYPNLASLIYGYDVQKGDMISKMNCC